MLKKIILSFTIFFTLLGVVFSNPGNLDIALSEIIPNPVEPGADVIVQVNLYNPSNDNVVINEINIDLKNNFILRTKSNEFNDEIICSRCSKTVSFYLNANERLETGIYPIEVEVLFSTSFTSKIEILLNVVGSPQLILNSNLEGDIAVGEEFTLNFDLLNVGTNDAQNIRVITPSSTIGFLNQNFIFIESLEKNQETSFSGSFFSSRFLETGFNQIPLIIEFEDSKNNHYQIEQSIGINFKDKANIVLKQLDLPSKILINEPFEISLRLENDGYGKAKDVRIIMESDLIGIQRAYFGTIQRDRDIPFITELISKNSGEKNFNLIIKYMDDFGEHEVSYPVSLYVEDLSFIQKYLNYFILGIFIIFILLIIIFKRKKHHGY